MQVMNAVTGKDDVGLLAWKDGKNKLGSFFFKKKLSWKEERY